MPSFEIVKTDKGFRGYTQADHEAYLAHKRKLEEMEPGEFCEISVTWERDNRSHRRFMALMRFLFEHWEPAEARKPLKYRGKVIEKNFDAFRKSVVILAGFYKESYELGPRGGVKVRLEARSISFRNMPEEDFQKLCKKVIDVAIKHFMPKGYETPERVRQIIETIEGFDTGGGPA
jgi:hypothetical protein